MDCPNGRDELGCMATKENGNGQYIKAVDLDSLSVITVYLRMVYCNYQYTDYMDIYYISVATIARI